HRFTRRRLQGPTRAKRTGVRRPARRLRSSQSTARAALCAPTGGAVEPAGRLFSGQDYGARNRPAMKVAIIKERRAHERRVAASPDSVKHMVGLGLEPVVETGAGAAACFTDAGYSAAG